MRLAARSTVIAGALATAAIASPLASARFNLEPTPTTGQTQTTVTAPVVRPNPDQQVTQVSQAGPPTLQSAKASQLPAVHRAENAASHASAYQPAQSARYSTAGLNGYVNSPTGGPAVVHVTTHSNPFDWGDAAIGAAVGLVISLLIIGGGIVVTQRRQPKPTRAKALA
jgi:hypothetical protein